MSPSMSLQKNSLLNGNMIGSHVLLYNTNCEHRNYVRQTPHSDIRAIHMFWLLDSVVLVTRVQHLHGVIC